MDRLLLFAKRPRLGKVKTRLCPPLSAPQALDLYRAFLADQLALLRRLAGRYSTELCLDGAWEALPEPPRSTRQGPGDLGQRLGRAFRRCFDEGSRAVVVVGVDSPTLPESLIDRAFERLVAEDRAVISPAADGGYVLLGMSRPFTDLFERIPWGGSEVYAETLARAERRSIPLESLEPWYDVDDVEGLRRLREELGERGDVGARLRAPRTAEWLRRFDER